MWRVADVASALGIGVRTVEHIKERFVEDGLEERFDQAEYRSSEDYLRWSL